MLQRIYFEFTSQFIAALSCTLILGFSMFDYLRPQYSELFHDYMWQVAFIVMVIFMWLVWIDKVVTREKSKISFSP